VAPILGILPIGVVWLVSQHETSAARRGTTEPRTAPERCRRSAANAHYEDVGFRVVREVLVFRKEYVREKFSQHAAPLDDSSLFAHAVGGAFVPQPLSFRFGDNQHKRRPLQANQVSSKARTAKHHG
jgi:hypothetical protein